MIVLEHSPGWLAAVLVVAVGTFLFVSGAAFAASLVRCAVWQRTFWQVAILSILVLLAAEATGFSNGVVQWWRFRSGRETASRSGLPLTLPSPTSGEGSHAEVISYQSRTGIAAGVAWSEAGEGSAMSVAPWLLPGSRDDATANSTIRPIPALEPDQCDADSGDASPGFTGAAGASGFGEDARAVWLAMAWGVGTGLLLAYLGVTHWRLWRFRQRQPRLHDLEFQRRVERLAVRLGWRRRLDLLQSSDLATPIALGIFRPAIVFPAGFHTEFERSQQDAILAHEVAHLAAGDPVWHLLADVAVALLWWHPAVWWARRRYREAGELAADEASLLVPDGADALATCLVALARRMEPGARWASLGMAGAGWRSGLARRVQRLLDLSARTWRPVKRGRNGTATVTITVFFVLVAISCTAWARTRAPVAEGVTTMKVFVNCWRQSLAAVTLAAVLSPAVPDDSQALAAEAERDAPRISAEAEREREREPERERKPELDRERERELKDAPREHAERKPEASPERQHRAESAEAREVQEREWAKRRDQLREKGNEIRHRLRALPPDREAERRELIQALERLEVQLRQLEAQAPGRQREREQPERDPVPVRREAEVERRQHHLRVAIDNLRAAGWHDLAEALARDAKELPRGDRPGPERERHPEAHMERAIHELRAQVQELRHQLEEIRRHLKESAERR
jgi:beta-lactamase regulating signal transducer with metallopeptidase domain